MKTYIHIRSAEHTQVLQGTLALGPTSGQKEMQLPSGLSCSRMASGFSSAWMASDISCPITAILNFTTAPSWADGATLVRPTIA